MGCPAARDSRTTFAPQTYALRRVFTRAWPSPHSGAYRANHVPALTAAADDDATYRKIHRALGTGHVLEMGLHPLSRRRPQRSSLSLSLYMYNHHGMLRGIIIIIMPQPLALRLRGIARAVADRRPLR